MSDYLLDTNILIHYFECHIKHMFYGKISDMKKFAQWGLSLEEIAKLGERLVSFYERFACNFRTILVQYEVDALPKLSVANVRE